MARNRSRTDAQPTDTQILEARTLLNDLSDLAGRVQATARYAKSQGYPEFWADCVDHSLGFLMRDIRKLKPHQLLQASRDYEDTEYGLLTPALRDALAAYEDPENQPVQLTTFPDF